MSSHGKWIIVATLVLAGKRVEAYQTPEIQRITELELQVKKLTLQLEDLRAQLRAQREEALKSRLEADEARKVAELSRQEALVQREKADASRQQAEEARKAAEDQARKALVAEQRAREESEAARQEALAQRDRAEAIRQQLERALKEAQAARQESQAEREAARAAEARARQDAELIARRARELEARIRELEAGRGGKGEDEAARKHMHALAEGFLEGVLARDGRSTSALLTKELRASFGKEGTPEFLKAANEWVDGLADGGRYAGAAIQNESFAPGSEEALFSGQLVGDSRGSFSIRVVKDKESGRYLVDYVVIRRR
jgi:membrane protein involved in colicin uptake